MRKFLLIAGAAALAAGIPALAQPEGKGRGGGGGPPHAERGHPGKGAGQDRRGGQEAERRADRGERSQRQTDRRAERAQRQAERRAEQAERGAERRFERRERAAERRLERGERRLERAERRAERPFRDRDRHGYAALPVQAVGPQGCPPGLAKQNAFCMPPGHLRRAQVVGQRLPVADWDYNVPDRYRYRFADGPDARYRWDDGYVYRLDPRTGLVESVIPVLASGLLTGEPMPLGYEIYNVPLSYRSYYPDTDDAWYRYDDNAIYEVDPETRLVESVVALLTGAGGLGGLGVGDMLPGGYDAYNVPLDYRDTYYDRPDAMYRYADGSIYQVDPQTRLIESVISLLT